MARDRLAHVAAFDDAPFNRGHEHPVLVVGTVFAGERLDGVLSTTAAIDGDDATAAIGACVLRSRHATGLHAILLQGIAMAGFNVIDLPRLAQITGLPVVAVARHRPRYLAMARALHRRVPGGRAKWQRLRRAGPMWPAAGVWVQAAGLPQGTVLADFLRLHQRYAKVPEPLRVAHLIAGGVVSGQSRPRV